MPVIHVCVCDSCEKRIDAIVDNGIVCVPKTWYITPSEIVACSLKCIREINNKRKLDSLEPLGLKRKKEDIRDIRLNRILDGK